MTTTPGSAGSTTLEPGSTATSSSMGGSEDSSTEGGPQCGNGSLDDGEECDGDDPIGAACLEDCQISCLQTFQDCDDVPTNGCEINTSDDPANCGACGNVCATGVCAESSCAPAIVVEDGLGVGATRIARIGDQLIFDESGFGRIWAWDIGAPSPTTLVANGVTGSFRGFALAAGHVYWLDAGMGAAQRVPTGGGEVEFLFSLEEAGAPFTGDTGLFFPVMQSENAVSNILQAPPAEADAPSVFVSDVFGLVCQVTSAGGRVIWGTTNALDPIQSLPPDGSGAPSSHLVLPQDACNRPLYGVGPSIYYYGRATAGGPQGLVSHNIGTETSVLLVQEPNINSFGDYYVSQHGIVVDVDNEVRVYDLSGNNAVTVGTTTQGSTGRYIDDQVVVWTSLGTDAWSLFVAARP